VQQTNHVSVALPHCVVVDGGVVKRRIVLEDSYPGVPGSVLQERKSPRIAAPVVHDDQLESRIGRDPQDAVDARRQDLDGVAGWNDDADKRCWIGGEEACAVPASAASLT